VASRSTRVGLPYEVRTYWSVHPVVLAQVILPVPLDRLALRPAWAEALLDGRPPLYPSLYLGGSLVFLAAAGLASGGRRPRLLLAGGLAVTALVALGRHTPFFGWLDALLPIGGLRYPVKAMPMVALLWAGLVVRGADALPRSGVGPLPLLAAVAVAGANGALAWLAASRPELGTQFATATGVALETALAGIARRLAVAAVAGTLAVAAALLVMRRRAPRRWLGAAAAVVGILELLVLHDGLSPTAPPALFAVRPPALDLATPPEGGRLYSYDYLAPGKAREHLHRDSPYAVLRAPVGWAVPGASALAMRLSLSPPTAGAWEIAGSFDRDVPGLAPRELALLPDLLIAAEGTPAHLRLLQLGAVSRVAALHAAGLEPLESLGTRDALLPEPVSVYAVPASATRSSNALISS
jgi:hypothetical protein